MFGHSEASVRAVAGLESILGAAVGGDTDTGIAADLFEGEHLGAHNLLDFEEAVCRLAVSYAQLAICCHLQWLRKNNHRFGSSRGG